MTASSKVGTEGERYIGVVAGGYRDPIPATIFKVVVSPDSAARYSHDIGLGAIVRAVTEVVGTEGKRFSLVTFGVIENIEILPSHVYESAKEMAMSPYYADPEFPKVFSSTEEDALELTVRSIGHLSEQGRIYGPVRPPERESRVYLATSDEIKLVLMRYPR